MDENRIQELANAYKAALLDELQSKRAMAFAQTACLDQASQTLSAAYEAGTINGKNVDTRKRQEAAVLMNDSFYQGCLTGFRTAEDNTGHATIGRQYYDALIGLTKAWLYSQGGH